MGRDVPSRERENQVVLALVLLAVFLSGNRFIYFSLYTAAAVYMILRTLYAGFRKREKTFLCVGYLVLLALQLVYAETVIFEPGRSPILHWLLRATGVLAMALPLFVERFITANKNAIPNDPEKPTVTSGIRVGTPAVTSRGFKEAEMVQIASMLARAARDFEGNAEQIRREVVELCGRFPIY